MKRKRTKRHKCSDCKKVRVSVLNRSEIDDYDNVITRNICRECAKHYTFWTGEIKCKPSLNGVIKFT